MPGIFDGYSARIVEQAGFPAGFISGAGLSEALLGQPDVGLMGLETNVNACRALAACCTIPLLADADTGYGNAVNVYHVVRAFEQAGIAGIMLEDQTWPKRCGHMSGKVRRERRGDGREAARCDGGAPRSRFHHQVAHRLLRHARPRRSDPAAEPLRRSGRGPPLCRRAAIRARHRDRRTQRIQAFVREHGLRHTKPCDDAAHERCETAGARRRRRSSIRDCSRPARYRA